MDALICPWENPRRTAVQEPTGIRGMTDGLEESVLFEIYPVQGEKDVPYPGVPLLLCYVQCQDEKSAGCFGGNFAGRTA